MSLEYNTFYGTLTIFLSFQGKGISFVWLL